MADNITNCLGESCVGCDNLHMHIGQLRCFKNHKAEGEFICWPKIGTQYPKPIYNNCYKHSDEITRAI